MFVMFLFLLLHYFHFQFTMIYYSLILHDALPISMSKLQSTKVADKVMYECLQMLGGYGYMEEYPLARLLRDSRLGPIGGGTSEILREIISKMVIDGVSYKSATK